MLALCACGDVDIVDHDPLLEVPPGNQAEAEDLCGALPDGVVPIEGLTTAWVMPQVPVKDRDATFRVATSSMVLRLSDDEVPCGGALEPAMLGCPHAWALDLGLRDEGPREGLFPLGVYGQGYEMSTAYRVDGECTGDRHKGWFTSGTLEIFTVTDRCVVGRLVDTADALDDAGAPVEGGFVALRCDAEP